MVSMRLRIIPCDYSVCIKKYQQGPFTVVNTSSHIAVTLQTDEGMLFKVNSHHLKIFLEPEKTTEERWIFIFYLNYTTAINRYEIYHKNMIFRDRIEIGTHARKVTLWD
jgi:hypothetical protein